jgi:hypothetical protein
MSFQCRLCGRYFDKRRGLSYHQNRGKCFEPYLATLNNNDDEAPQQAALPVLAREAPPSPVESPPPADNEEANPSDDGMWWDAPQPSPAVATIHEQQPIESTNGQQQPVLANGLSATQLPKAINQSRRKRVVQFDVCPMPLLPPQQQEDQLMVANTPTTNETDHNHVTPPLGRPYPLPIPQQGIIQSVAPHDHSMARLYKVCDAAGAPNTSVISSLPYSRKKS